MQGYKSHYRGGDRGDSRPRQRGPADQAKPYTPPHRASNENPSEAAARVINLKLLQSVVGDDTALLALALEMAVPRLQSMLDGQVEVDSGLAMHLETTLGLPPRWLDKKHAAEDIGEHTRKILLGEDVSESGHALQSVEQQGHAIMKKTAASPAPSEKDATAAAPATDVRQQHLPHVEEPAGSSAATVTTVEDLIPVRVNNLRLLTQARGAKTKMAKAISVSESFISFLFNGKKDFTAELARSIEKAVGLPADWMDWEHVAKDVPEQAWAVLGTPAEPNATTPAPAAAPARSATPAAAPAAKQEDLSAALGEMSDFSLNLSSAPSVLSAPQEPMADAARVINEAKAPKSKVAPAVPAKEAAPAAKAETRPAAAKTGKTEPAAPKASASKPAATAQKPVAAPAPTAPAAAPAPQAAAQPAPAVAAQQPAPAAESNALALQDGAPTSLEPAVDILPATKTNIAAMQLLQPDVLGIGPMTEALIKTLILRARKNELTERDAYRMLGEVNGFIDQ